jgi:hypothetical protein
MNEVLAYSFEPVNLFPTILLIITVLYWMAVMLGALDMGFLDFDLDADFETDVEVDIDLGSEVDGDVSSGFLQTFLSFLNLGKVPAMVFFSALSMSFWLLTININFILGIGGLLVFPVYALAFITSMFFAKFLTFPLVPVFNNLNREGKSKFDLAGALGRNVLTLEPGMLGQAKITKDEDTFTIKIKAANQSKLLKNQQIIVIDYIENGGYFIVEAFKF